MRVLVIEDDQAIIETIMLSFRVGWPEVELISTRLGEEGVEFVENLGPEVLILDLGLPDISGFEVIKRIRLFSNIPILVLTQDEDEKSTVKALEWGADEYIIKPFRQMELLARIKSLLRRQHSTPGLTTETIGPFSFDPEKYHLKYKNKPVSLTRTEYIIFYQLALNRDRVVSNASLAEHIWESNYPSATEAIRVYIRRLRQKLESNPNQPKLILTQPGMGYKLVTPSA